MTDAAEIKKKRRVPRRVFEATIGLLVRGRYHLSQSLQIGEGGMMITSEDPLDEGQMIVITYKLPEAPTTVVRGLVRYAIAAEGDLPARYGVEFVKIDFNTKRNIRSYVASKSEAEARRSADGIQNRGRVSQRFNPAG